MRPMNEERAGCAGLLSGAERQALVRRLLQLMRDEDGGRAGDVTSRVSVGAAARCTAAVVAREAGVIAGLALIEPLLVEYAARVRVRLRARDGQRVRAGAELARLTGPARDVLRVERAVLNLLGRLSGVATRTAAFVRAAGPRGRGRIYDTRKTTPGLRVVEKYAVCCGGGMTHRLGLHDAVLIKDNHLAGVAPERLASHLARVLRRARRVAPDVAFVEVEVDTLEQLRSVLSLEGGLVDVVLLDNFAPARLRQAVRLRDRLQPGVRLEASGGVTLETVREVVATGVDRVSVGSLTHQAVWLDIGLDVVRWHRR